MEQARIRQEQEQAIAFNHSDAVLLREADGRLADGALSCATIQSDMTHTCLCTFTRNCLRLFGEVISSASSTDGLTSGRRAKHGLTSHSFVCGFTATMS
jgi:hypothetical protein